MCRPRGTFEFPHEQNWSVPAPWLSLRYAWAEAPALVAYLVATPEARVGLRNEQRLLRLVGDIKTSPTFERLPPGLHMMGDKLDIDLACEQVFAALGLRRFGGRPVRGESRPSSAELVPAVRDALPSWVKQRTPDNQIDRQIARLLDVRPWPFDCLVDEKREDT